MRSRPLVIVAALVAMAAACGIPTDESPVAIAPTPIPSTSPTASVEPQEGAIFLLGEPGELVAVERTIDVDQPVASLISALGGDLAQSESDDGLSSAVPSGITLLSSRQEGGTLLVDLAGLAEITDTDAQRDALAQLVFTLTGRGGVDQVLFRREGQAPVNVPTSDGQVDGTEPLSRADYSTYMVRDDE
jgi:spore germination protein GerM